MIPTKFVAIDIETADHCPASICQVAIISFEKDSISDYFETLINPLGSSWAHSRIHKITEEQVTKSPTFIEVEPIIRKYLNKRNVVAHNAAFERNCFNNACESFDLPLFDCEWVDSVKLARIAWPNIKNKKGKISHTLDSVCDFLEIELDHHDAFSDALAAAKIAMMACLENNEISFREGYFQSEWMSKKKYITEYGIEIPYYSNAQSIIEPPESENLITVSDMKNKDGEIYVTFTGAFKRVKSALKYDAIQLGCEVLNNATKQTTVLVVGSFNENRVNDKKSSKQKRIEELNKDGANIPIVNEDDFFKAFQTKKKKQ